ncbi:MAG: hypothetical protein ACRDDY_18510 [Clostridium sp.]|uniref:hypothetical protein n=1 Tax=Clostridium sp. TaxID=1506 RepID=UPI003EE42BB9
MDSFEYDKIYVFDKNRYLIDERKDNSLSLIDKYEYNPNIKSWVDNLHMQEVIPVSDTLAKTKMYQDIVSINWCSIKEDFN